MSTPTLLEKGLTTPHFWPKTRTRAGPQVVTSYHGQSIMTHMYSDVFNAMGFYIKYDKNVILLKKIIKTINQAKDLMKILKSNFNQKEKTNILYRTLVAVSLIALLLDCAV